MAVERAYRASMSGANLEVTGKAAIFHDGVIIPETIFTRPGFQVKPGDVF